MLIDITPLRKYRDFRWLYYGQFISLIGSMISYVAVPYQVYQLTKNNAIVGALGVVQLVPMILFSLLGGTYADRLNRQKLLIYSESIMILITALFVWNSMLSSPSVILIFILTAILQAINGFHRPAMEALTQQMVGKSDYPQVGALTSFRYSLCAIIGPAIGGVIIATFGTAQAYIIDALTFVFAVFCLLQLTKIPNAAVSKKTPLEDMKEGFAFAISKPELIGTYIIDIVAMGFAFPLALYPAMSEQWGGAEVAGWLFSAMSVGALVATLFSGWANKVHLRGKGVVIAAAMWGVFIVGTGYTNQMIWAFVFLALAGGADMFSALFRKVIWNETIPNHMRGRLSGIEMVSYTAGPLIGNARAGYIAAKTSVNFSLTSGGYICVAGVIITAFLLPKFWRYRSE
jgi:MFS family permease